MDSPPSESSIDALNTATPNLADKATLADGHPECSIDALNAVHKTWQLNTLWQMDPPNAKRQFHTATNIYWSGMAILHCSCHLVVKNGNFTLLLMFCGQEWQFHIATEI